VTFPTVKSSPYGVRKARRREDHLWPRSWWKELCEQAEADRDLTRGRAGTISPACLEMIAEFNRRIS
jgi:hypothetical protein